MPLPVSSAIPPSAKRPHQSSTLKILSFGQPASSGVSRRPHTQTASRPSGPASTPRTPPSTRGDTNPIARRDARGQESQPVGRRGLTAKRGDAAATSSKPHTTTTVNQAPKKRQPQPPPAPPANNRSTTTSSTGNRRVPLTNQSRRMSVFCYAVEVMVNSLLGDRSPSPNNGRAARGVNQAHRSPTRGRQANNQRNPPPLPRSPTPSDIIGEQDLADTPEEADVPDFPNAQGSPTDPGTAIVSTSIIVICLVLTPPSFLTTRPHFGPSRRLPTAQLSCFGRGARQRWSRMGHMSTSVVTRVRRYLRTRRLRGGHGPSQTRSLAPTTRCWESICYM